MQRPSRVTGPLSYGENLTHDCSGSRYTIDAELRRAAERSLFSHARCSASQRSANLQPSHGHGSSAGLASTWEGAIDTAADSNARPRPCSGILERRGTDYRAPDRPAYGSCALSPAEFSLRTKVGNGAEGSCSARC
jgi:hypothetical protein